MNDFSRTYPERPIACAAAIVLRDDSVLLVRRGREPNYGRWTFPGGAIELGETSRECAMRELTEETGVRGEILALVEVIDCVFRSPDGRVEYHYLNVDYLARATGGTPRPAGDVLAAAWVPLADAAALDLAPPTAEVLEKAVSAWRGISREST